MHRAMILIAFLSTAYGVQAQTYSCPNGRCQRPSVAAYAPRQATQWVRPEVSYVPNPIVAPRQSYAAPVNASQSIASAQYSPLAQVNGARVRAGLRPLAWDSHLASSCARNNQAQAIYGIGHYVVTGSQCAARDTSEAGAVSQWLGSRPHYAIMMNPSATRGAVNVSSGYATLEVR